jgi:phosphoribosylformylglycinamidine cyclo-ligase
MSEDNSYKEAGVDYDVLDAIKRQALMAALSTSPGLQSHRGSALDDSRGGPAFIFEVGGVLLATVQECLGTKSVIARLFQELTGENRFADVAYDAVSAIANDLVTVGALPVVINAYFAVGSARWFDDGARAFGLIEGWRKGCEDSGATWGGGESPALPGLVSVEDIELAGSGVGLFPNGRRPLLGDALAVGDEIVLVGSSGIHTNGLSLALKVARQRRFGLGERLPSGESFGSALLRPSIIYVPLVRALLEEALEITYMSHITGHGMRKLMRADRDLAYRILELPAVPEVLGFIVDALNLDQRNAYGTLNMGAGFALFTRRGAGEKVVAIARRCGFHASVAGVVENGPRRVVIEPLGVVFEDKDLRLR